MINSNAMIGAVGQCFGTAIIEDTFKHRQSTIHLFDQTDKISKYDHELTLDNPYMLIRIDYKTSLKYNNFTIEIDHPFFNMPNDSNFFVGVVSAEKFVWMVKTTQYFIDKYINDAHLRRDKNGKPYYLILNEELKLDHKKDPDNFKQIKIPNEITFQEYFQTKYSISDFDQFKTDEEKMIYANTKILGAARAYFSDIPE